MSRAARERMGRRAEMVAAWYLRIKGWRILARRVKNARGEVDIVARRGRMVAFVEVKYRQRSDRLDQAIDQFRLRRVAAAAEAMGHTHLRQGDDMRIDVLLLAPGRFPRHITNAFQP